eukprot:4500410-Pyramimonas_sp.AAC.1
MSHGGDLPRGRQRNRPKWTTSEPTKLARGGRRSDEKHNRARHARMGRGGGIKQGERKES